MIRREVMKCKNCGTPLSQPELKTTKPEVVNIPKKEPIKPKKGISPAIWVLGGVFGVIILCLAAFLLGLIKVPVPPEPNTSILPEFVVSAWTGAYQYQTTGSFSLTTAATGQTGYVEALFNCDEKGNSPVSATTGGKIFDVINWVAGTQTQSEDFLKYIKFTVSVNENPANFQGPFMSEIKFDQQKSYYSTSALVALPDLAVGTHHIKTEITWSQNFTDGAADYGPGSSNEKLVGNCTVVITQSDSAAGQKAATGNVNKIAGKDCLPLLVKEDCVAKSGKWTTNEFTGEEFCTCNANDPKGECLKNNGMWFENKQFCSYLENPFPVCIPTQPQANCEAMDATWLVNDITGEGYCVCDTKDPKNECETYGGIWDEKIQRCSFQGGNADELQIKTGCPDLLNHTPSGFPDENNAYAKECISRGGYIDVSRNAPTIDCICPNSTTVQPVCKWNNENINGKEISHSIDCNTFHNRCMLSIRPDEAFSKTPDVVIKLKNGKTISSQRTGGMVYCNIDHQLGEWRCEFLNNEALYGVPEMKGEEDVQDIYICAGLCCVDLKKLESGTDQTFALTNNCPLSSDLSASIKEWKAGKMTMEIENKTGWTASTMSTDLKDSQGNNWTTLDCKRKSDNDKLMICEGWASGKTGSASLSFSYSGSGGVCSISELKFPIPCATPCQGTCCPAGMRCCLCGCRLLTPSISSCSSACS